MNSGRPKRRIQADAIDTSSSSSSTEKKSTRAIGFVGRDTKVFDQEKETNVFEGSQHSQLTDDANSSQSQKSSQEEILSPVTKTNSNNAKPQSLKRSSSMFFAQQSDDKEEQPTAKKAKSFKPDLSIISASLTEAFDEFFESKEFNAEENFKIQITADIFQFIADLCPTHDLQQYVATNNKSDIIRTREVERAELTRQNVLDMMRVESYVIATILGKKESEQDLEEFILGNLRVYLPLATILSSIPNQSEEKVKMVGATHRLLQQKFRGNRKVIYQNLNPDERALLSTFNEYFIEVLALRNGFKPAPAPIPDLKTLVIENLQRYLDEVKRKFLGRRNDFVTTLMYQFGRAIIDNHIYVPGADVTNALAKIFLNRAVQAGSAEAELYLAKLNPKQPATATSSEGNSLTRSKTNYGLSRLGFR